VAPFSVDTDYFFGPVKMGTLMPPFTSNIALAQDETGRAEKATPGSLKTKRVRTPGTLAVSTVADSGNRSKRPTGRAKADRRAATETRGVKATRPGRTYRRGRSDPPRRAHGRRRANPLRPANTTGRFVLLSLLPQTAGAWESTAKPRHQQRNGKEACQASRRIRQICRGPETAGYRNIFTPTEEVTRVSRCTLGWSVL
jgi:hypothetical protein